MLSAWKRLPSGLRRTLMLLVKVGLTVGAFYPLLTHEVDAGEGRSVAVWSAIVAHVGHMDPRQFIPFVLLAASIKAVGILSSMLRWHLLLIGQKIRFNFWHVIGSFLIGRFLGTFLPSTVGLDGYKLYDAARFSDRVVEPAAATAVEKVMGLSGMFLTFLVALPFGYQVLGDAAGAVIATTVPVATALVATLFLVLFRPGLVQALLAGFPSFGRRRVQNFVTRVSQAAVAYRGRAWLLVAVTGLSFMVHFCTAAMYFCTALAVGAATAEFWEVTFASSIQMFATVMSPFTVGGEGIREIVQALLLAKRIGASESVLSAALGFWAAEAMTMVGAFFWWSRRNDYRPRIVEVTCSQALGCRASASAAGDADGLGIGKAAR